MHFAGNILDTVEPPLVAWFLKFYEAGGSSQLEWLGKLSVTVEGLRFVRTCWHYYVTC